MKRRHYIVLTGLLLTCQISHCQSIVNTVHNLSVTGPGTIKASSEQEICLFCHTPHSSKANSPLWNKEDPGVFYDLYSSTTIQSVPGQPTGSSLLCLSCHDGTIALGNVLSRTTDINFSGAITHLPPGSTNLSTDLRDDHPFSFPYSSSLAVSDGQLYDPSLISFPVSLEDTYVQCTSCHDPHKNLYSNFLVTSTQYSELCLKCHNRTYWATSSHSTSTATWNDSIPDPWFHTMYNSVSENACENCHNPHSAEGNEGLKNFIAEESNCLICHNGNVSVYDIQSELSKTYSHAAESYNLIHDPAEDPLVTVMHVECEDCHNPHAVNDATGTAPNISGAQTGVPGLSLNGTPLNPALYQYEVCLRCHGNSPGRPDAYTTRQIEQTNIGLEINPGNPSFHPLASVGQNSDVPSLISTLYTESSMIYCTDCHSSDGSTAEGPHGSNWQALLKYQYETADYTSESVENYALCYSCHSRTSILADESFSYHNKHIVEENSPCNSCHDPHGISSTQGNTTNNTHLINFDVNIVEAGGSGTIRFVDTGYENGYCMLRCHNKGHGPGMSY